MDLEITCILLVEDSHDFAQLMSAHLRRAFDAVKVVHVERLQDCRNQLRDGEFSLILLDLNLPDSTGLETLASVLPAAAQIPIVVLTGLEDEKVGDEAVRTGAQDYILKDALDEGTLVRSVRFAMERSHRQQADLALSHAFGELDAAREAQQRLFPDAAPVIAGFDFAGFSVPAESAGGDYYDYLTLPDGRILSVVGDVSGHGLSAALLMVEVRACLQTLTNFTSDLSKMFTFLEEQLSTATQQQHFLTMFGLILDPDNATYEFIGAGHCGFHVKSNGEFHELRGDNALLGFELNDGFKKSRSHQLESGDLLFMPTDGLQESCNAKNEMFGEARLLETVTTLRTRPAADIIAAVDKATASFRGTMPQQDDITAVVIKRT